MKKLILLLFLCFCAPVVARGLTLNEIELQPIEYKEILQFNKPVGYIGIQGMAVTDKYFVVAVVNSDNTSTALVIIDKKTKELADLEVNPIIGDFGHANDMEYDSTTNELYIINNEKIHILDASTFKLIKDVSLPDNLNVQSIAKDDKGNYYFRDKSYSYTYDANLKFVSKFSVSGLTGRQGMAYQNGKMYYTCYPKLTIDNENVNNLIYVYNGEKLENILLAPNDYGEVEAMEFYDGLPYVLYSGADKIGRILVPVYESISINLSVADKTSDTLDATLSSNNKLVEQVKKEDGKYSFSPITYEEPGKYQYLIQKLYTKRNTSDEQTSTIGVNVDVEYDASKNQLLANVNYDEEEFKEEPKETKPVEDSNTNNGDADNKANQENQQNPTDINEIENPQTGYISIACAILLILTIIVSINLYHKKKLYKL